MRKLLRFILSLMVTTPTSISLVACGGAVYPVHKKDLKGLSDNLDITTLDNNVKVFKVELINKLRKKTFSNLQLSDVKISKNNNTPLQDTDIKNRKLIIKIIALSTSINFTGEKTININITTTQEKKDLNLLIANQNLGFIKILAKNLIPTKEELLIGIKSINYDASILTINDFNIKGSINTTSAIIEGTGDYKGEITLSYRQEFDFNIWNFLDILVMGHMKNKGYWLENMKLNIKNNEI
ncbi:hypothetical protein [Spiroplasma endosymbiont of Amphimallon solstitiale]|uniref:hypothetical protein n=1 Tax=Spiroplasma endosymbiont of Amphimallon solstitiale TaxID=3066288 RepID=UPI00313D8EDE